VNDWCLSLFWGATVVVLDCLLHKHCSFAAFLKLAAGICYHRLKQSAVLWSQVCRLMFPKHCSHLVASAWLNIAACPYLCLQAQDNKIWTVNLENQTGEPLIEADTIWYIEDMALSHDGSYLFYSVSATQMCCAKFIQ
jgi:hypothetical protein